MGTGRKAAQSGGSNDIGNSPRVVRTSPAPSLRRTPESGKTDYLDPGFTGGRIVQILPESLACMCKSESAPAVRQKSRATSENPEKQQDGGWSPIAKSGFPIQFTAYSSDIS
jgi:hypothetical protein